MLIIIIMAGDCVFCKIISGELPRFTLDESESVIVFLSLEGHPMIVPKKHVADIFSLEDATAEAVMKEAVKMARAVKKGLSCDGIYIAQANGAAAGQEVFHYHMHIYPRWNDGCQSSGGVEGKRQTEEKIKKALQKPL